MDDNHEFGRPNDDPDVLEDYLMLDGDWIDDIHTYEIHAKGHNIKFRREGHRCIIEIEVRLVPIEDLPY